MSRRDAIQAFSRSNDLSGGPCDVLSPSVRSGARGFVPTMLAVDDARWWELRRILNISLASASLCLALLAAPDFAMADDRDRLTPGLYVAATVGCDGLGGAGTVDFDGKNFSPHYQACLTQPLQQNARYRQTCAEGQGQNWPTAAQIQADPDKTTKDVTIAVLSEKSFNMNGTRYDYCGAR